MYSQTPTFDNPFAQEPDAKEEFFEMERLQQEEAIQYERMDMFEDYNS
jgi:hypothetical protein